MKTYRPDDLGLEDLLDRVLSARYVRDGIEYRGFDDNDIDNFYRVCDNALLTNRRININVARLTEDATYTLVGHSNVFNKDFVYQGDVNPVFLNDSDKTVSVMVRQNDEEKLYLNARISARREFLNGKYTRAKASFDVKYVDPDMKHVDVFGEIVFLGSRNGTVPRFEYSEDEYFSDLLVGYDIGLRELRRLNTFVSIVGKKNRKD